MLHFFTPQRVQQFSSLSTFLLHAIDPQQPRSLARMVITLTDSTPLKEESSGEMDTAAKKIVGQASTGNHSQYNSRQRRKVPGHAFSTL